MPGELASSRAGRQPDRSDPWAAPAVWPTVVLPVLVCLPAALVACNSVQTRALATIAGLQILYGIVIRALLFSETVDNGTGASTFVANSLVLLAGNVCLLLAVRAGQRGR